MHRKIPAQSTRPRTQLQPDRESGLEIVLAEGLEGDLRLCREHAVNLVELVGNDSCDVVDLADADHGEEIEIASHRVDLADTIDVRDVLSGLRDA